MLLDPNESEASALNLISKNEYYASNINQETFAQQNTIHTLPDEEDIIELKMDNEITVIQIKREIPS